MSTWDYSKDQDWVHEEITYAGQTATLTKRTVTADPTEPWKQTVATATYNVKVVPYDMGSGDIVRRAELSGEWDRLVIVSPKDSDSVLLTVSPDKNDTLTINSEVWHITGLPVVVDPAATVVVWICGITRLSGEG